MQGTNQLSSAVFIPTAEYVASEMRKRLPKSIEVASVTGLLSPDIKGRGHFAIDRSKQTCFDCNGLPDEGINLQEHFDASCIMTFPGIQLDTNNVMAG